MHDSRQDPHGSLHSPEGAARQSVDHATLNATAFRATVHCLAGSAVGEVLGMVIGTAVGLSNVATVALAVVLAFGFGYAFTVFPLRRSGMARVFRLALAADTASITIMEIVDNALMLAIPGAMGRDWARSGSGARSRSPSSSRGSLRTRSIAG